MKIFTIIVAVVTIVISTVNLIYDEHKKNERAKQYQPVGVGQFEEKKR